MTSSSTPLPSSLLSSSSSTQRSKFKTSSYTSSSSSFSWSSSAPPSWYLYSDGWLTSMGSCRNLSKFISSTDMVRGLSFSDDEDWRALSLLVLASSSVNGFSIFVVDRSSFRVSVLSRTYERNFGTLASLTSRLVVSSGWASISRATGWLIASVAGCRAQVTCSSSTISFSSSSVASTTSSFSASWTFSAEFACCCSFSAFFCNCCSSHLSYLLWGLLGLLDCLLGGGMIELPLPGDWVVYCIYWDRYSKDCFASCLIICDLAVLIASSSNLTYFFCLLYFFLDVRMLFVLSIELWTSKSQTSLMNFLPIFAYISEYTASHACNMTLSCCSFLSFWACISFSRQSYIKFSVNLSSISVYTYSLACCLWNRSSAMISVVANSLT